MKHLVYRISQLLIVCLLAICFASCSKTDEPEYSGETATIRLNIPMLEAVSRAYDNEDRINTLRVVILSKHAGSINKEFSSEDLSSGSITIDNVPVGQVQIYVIANESTLGRDYSDLKNLQADLDKSVNKVLIKDEKREYFPKIRPDIDVTKGLPMSWMAKDYTIESTNGKQQTINVELIRAVAKLNIVMENTLDNRSMDISQIRLGAFFANSLYLFQEENLDVPDNTSYDSKVYDLSQQIITIKPKESKELACYIYPSWAWNDISKPSPYRIGIKANNSDYSDLPFMYKGQPMNSISRNTQVNIYASLVEPSKLDVKFSVAPWEGANVTVPPFE